MRIAPVTLAQLEAYARDPDEFAALIGSRVPAGWPEFPEGLEFTAATLRERPEQAGWWMHLFFVDDVLVGSGGFVGPRDDGVVEIGYEVAPEYRGNGYATAAARAMIAKAQPHVHTVIAHTLAQRNPSTAVLEKVGFRFVGEQADPEEGAVWRWEFVVE